MQWRTAGLNYVRYSQIAAQVVRQCLKDSKSATPKKSPASIKITPWQKGEPVKKEHGLALANDGDVDEETWLCDVADEPTIPSSADRGNQSSNELIEWLQGSTESIDYRTRSALSRRVRNHANKSSPRVPGNTLNEIDEITPIASPVPPLEVGVAQMITPRRSNVTIIRPKADVFHATPSPSSHLVTPHQAPKPNVNVKLRSNSRPPTAVVAPSKKAMTEPPRPATSLARRVPTTSMSSSFSQSNSRENSFQLSGGLMGDLYRSQLEKATKFEDIENIAKMQEQELLKQLEFGVRERKSSFQSDTPSRPGTAEGHLSSSRSVDFNSRFSPQPSVDSRTSSKLPVSKLRSGIPQPSTRSATSSSRLKTPLRTIASGSNGTPLSAPGRSASPQVASLRRKSTEMASFANQPLSAYEAPAPLAQSRTPLGHHHNIIGNGGGINRHTNGATPSDWTDECF
ncbi:hypothetical protein QR680_013413 [Steinernema hermaphroditum]|uniref:ATP synthase subunit epsilon, mitochondrial n=1 Tax=Steinernema hermaphroditum TaxID=289476 RepID=A0AA39M2H0_9BILA|nr:hypothetical protein QR680_013413 [Steinernema hermaphroditum]